MYLNEGEILLKNKLIESKYHKTGEPILFDPESSNLQEGLIGRKKTIIPYMPFLKDFQNAIQDLKKGISISLFKNLIKVFDTYPNFYIQSKNDFRLIGYANVTDVFDIDILSSKCGISTTTLINNLIDVVNDISNNSDFCKCRMIYSGSMSDNKVVIQIIMRDDFLLKDLVSQPEMKGTYDYSEIVREMHRQYTPVQSNLKSHPLGKFLSFKNSADKESYYKIDKSIARPITDDFSKGIFKVAYPNLDGWSAATNLIHYIDEIVLNTSFLRLVAMYSQTGSCVICLATRAGITTIKR